MKTLTVTGFVAEILVSIFFPVAPKIAPKVPVAPAPAPAPKGFALRAPKGGGFVVAAPNSAGAGALDDDLVVDGSGNLNNAEAATAGAAAGFSAGCAGAPTTLGAVLLIGG